LGISEEAVRLHLDCEVLDLHLDTFIWNRIWGYDLRTRHRGGLLGRRFYGQVDLPRALEAGLTGATWVITTNPFRPKVTRPGVFADHLHRLKALLASEPPRVRHVRSAAEYRAARAEGRHGAFIGVQGGNALDAHPGAIDLLDGGDVLRVTLVHLTHSSFGPSSAPIPDPLGRSGLTNAGRAFVEGLNAKKVFVDLAHIGRQAFFDAVEVHDRSQPLLVTHTGVDAVYPLWRNVTDAQLRAVADTGGVVGVMFQADFLGRRDVTSATVVDHLAHIVETVGEDHAALGSDWDGAIVPPPDLASPRDLPRLVQHMLDRGWSDDRVRKILGGNFLRTVAALRG